mgnify:CR=1 FL=1|tara:strand:- start:1373 stop:2155 length:783 start_codon:yes stop_codon:yes gene_type:complete
MQGIKVVVAAVVVQIVVFILAMYVAIEYDNGKLDAVNSEISSIKQKQKTADEKIGVVHYNYSDVANALSYHESSTENNIEEIKETISVLDNFTLNDVILEEGIKENNAAVNSLKATVAMVDVKVKVLQERLSQQEMSMAKVRKAALGRIPRPITVLDTEVTIKPEVVMPQEPIDEAMLYACPKTDSNVNYKTYIKNIFFNREVRFTVTYDIQDNKVSNVLVDKNISLKLIGATINYLNEAVSTENNMVNCRVSFRIKDRS